MLILPIWEYGGLSTSQYLFSFFSVSWFSLLRTFISLVNLIPISFIFPLAVVDRRVHFSVSSLLIYRKAPDVCKFILYSATLKGCFSDPKDFWLKSFRFYMHRCIPSACRDSLNSPFLAFMTFISFSCLVYLVNLSNAILSKCGRSGHKCLGPDLRWNVFRFPHVV